MIKRVERGVPVSDGAGVRLNRIIGRPGLQQIDPFLMLDEFRSDDPDDYIAGFPPHPHRGFETVTYLVKGGFRHEDSRGNSGELTEGSVQWMTAGSGIIHSEMPTQVDGMIWGFQLWLNLPSEHKMTEPRYQDLASDAMPTVPTEFGSVKIISGQYQSKTGIAKTFYPVIYFDVRVEQGKTFRFDLLDENHSFLYLFMGEAIINEQHIESGHLLELTGGELVVKAEQESGFILASAKPIGEPVARYGPFVMNTADEINQAIADYQNGLMGQLP